MGEAISDDVLVDTLSAYAGLAALALADPRAWLGRGVDEDPTDSSGESLLGQVSGFVSDRVRGRVHPGSPGWDGLPAEDRAQWWVDQVGTLVACVAATPRFFGALADRLPVQSAFGAAAQGVVVCAVAREHGVGDPDAWVPLLGTVLFHRDLPRGRTETALTRLRIRRASSDGHRDDAPAPGRPPGSDLEPLQDFFLGDGTDLDGMDLSEDSPPGRRDERGGRVRRAARVVWRLARALLAVEGLLDERPRGKFRYRALGKVPVVGVVGGFLDERGGIRQAARRTEEVLQGRRGDRGK